MPSKMERLEARITKEAKDLFQTAADLEGRTLTDFVVTAALEAARRTIQHSDLIRLTARDQERFVEVLLGPQEPNAKLREAAARYRKVATKNK